MERITLFRSPCGNEPPPAVHISARTRRNSYVYISAAILPCYNNCFAKIDIQLYAYACVTLITPLLPPFS